MMITAVGLQYYVFAESFFHQWYNNDVADDWHLVEVNIYSLLNALYGISAVLISFGALIGKVWECYHHYHHHHHYYLHYYLHNP